MWVKFHARKKATPNREQGTHTQRERERFVCAVIGVNTNVDLISAKRNAVSEGCNSVCAICFTHTFFIRLSPPWSVYVCLFSFAIAPAMFSVPCHIDFYLFRILLLVFFCPKWRATNIFFIALANAFWFGTHHSHDFAREHTAEPSQGCGASSIFDSNVIYLLQYLCVYTDCHSGKGAIKSKLMTFYMSNKGKHFTHIGRCFLVRPHSYRPTRIAQWIFIHRNIFRGAHRLGVAKAAAVDETPREKRE